MFILLYFIILLCSILVITYFNITIWTYVCISTQHSTKSILKIKTLKTSTIAHFNLCYTRTIIFCHKGREGGGWNLVCLFKKFTWHVFIHDFRISYKSLKSTWNCISSHKGCINSLLSLKLPSANLQMIKKYITSSCALIHYFPILKMHMK